MEYGYKTFTRLNEIIDSVSEDAYKSCVGDIKKEEDFWNNFAQVARILEVRLHEKQAQWFDGVSDLQLRRIIYAMMPVVSKKSWTVKPYKPKQSEKVTLKIKPIIAMLHNIYDFEKRTVLSPVVFFNSQPPKIFVEIEAVIEGLSTNNIKSMSVELPAEYVQKLYGLEKEPTEENQFKYEIVSK